MDTQFSRSGFAARYVLPIFTILALPLFSVWFFNYAVTHRDAQIRDRIIANIEADDKTPPDEKKQAIKWFTENPVSQLLESNDPDTASLRDKLREVAGDYATFRWSAQLARVCLYASLAAIALGVFLVLLSMISPLVQYWTLALAWHTLKLFALVQFIAQGVLAVELSYWVTVIFTNSYSGQVVFCIGAIVVVVTLMIVVAIFQKVDATHVVDGELLAPSRAARLWARVGELAGKLGIDKPDHILVGVEGSFFVTEHPVTVDGRVLEGRTLFVGLPLLKTLERDEADAVLAHELAHFSGDDTLFSRKTSVILAQYDGYLGALSQNPASLPMLYFMLGFRSLFELSLQRTQRARELRADAIAAQAISADALGRSLVKVAVYSTYRASVERELFAEERPVEQGRLAARIEGGYPEFVRQGVSGDDLRQVRTHPFDSHPPLLERLQAVGHSLDAGLSSLGKPVTSPWTSDIESVEEIEARLWDACDAQFRQVQEKALAYRYLPASPEECAIVERHFPQVTVPTKNGGHLVMSYLGVQHSSWAEPVKFHEIVKCMTMTNNGRPVALDVTCRPPGATAEKVVRIDLTELAPTFPQAFGVYWGRCQAAQQYVKAKPAQAVV